VSLSSLRLKLSLRASADGGVPFAANTQELVGDFLRKAKQLEYLITVLPTPPPTFSDGDKPADGSDPEFNELERELKAANEEYLEALSVAGKHTQSAHFTVERLQSSSRFASEFTS